MATSKQSGMEQQKEHLAMNRPPIVSPQEWEAARQQLLVKEKAFEESLTRLLRIASGWGRGETLGSKLLLSVVSVLSF